MLIYAALVKADRESGALANVNYPNLLTSFHYNKGNIKDVAKVIGYEPQRWLFDSGAFTVWKSGNQIDVAAYGSWCLERIEELGERCAFINLDVIPGDPTSATPPTNQERERAVAESMANADQLRALGVPLMEVYHRFEPADVLENLLARRQPGEVVGVGGLVGRSHARQKMPFCDSVWAVLRGAYPWDGMVKVHALGVGPDTLLGRRYPWWSMDSSSWTYSMRFGMAVRRGGKWRKTGSERHASHGVIRELNFQRILNRWSLAEQELSRLWQDRGISFAEEQLSPI